MQTSRAVAGLLVAAALCTPAVAASAWRLSVDRDPFSDEVVTFARAYGSNGGVAARCRGGVLEAYVQIDGFYSHDGAYVRWRVDSRPTQEGDWGSSTDGNGVFSARPAAFLHQLQAGGRLLFEAQDYFGTGYRVSVTLNGSGAAIGKVLAACGNPADEPAPAPPAPVAPIPASPPRPARPVITNPQWLRRPDAADVRAAYPPEALVKRLPGRASMECQVTADGGLTGCAISSETPAGAGFGEALLRLGSAYRMRASTMDGQPVEGAWVRVPFLFNPG